MSKKQPLISVVICTHNRVDLLYDVLQTLIIQTLESNFFEIIVIDNNSTDETRTAVEKFYNLFPNLRYYFETNIGLAYARNRGWQEAHGQYIAYTDDDCKIPAQWLSTAKATIEKSAPLIFGGPYFAFYKSPKPIWFKDEYGSRELGTTARVLQQHEYLSGGNLFINRQLLEKLDGFPTHLGMAGQRIAYGEETGLQMRFRELFPDQVIYYEPALYVYHLVRTEKLTIPWLARAFFHKGQYVYVTTSAKTSQPVNKVSFALSATKTVISAAGDCLYGIVRRDRKQYPYFQNYLYEHTSRYLRTLGKLYAQYQERIESAKLST
jgi:glycosyltransferase involved in cell wall biosynthesis